MLRTTFTPRIFSGLQLWLDAADSSTLFDATTGGSLPANNGSVARWMDKSPNAFDFTQGTANNRPVRKVQHLNGLDGVYFDGSNDCLYKAANVFDTTVTLLAVAAFDNNNSRRAVCDLNTQDGTNYRHFVLEQSNNSEYGAYMSNAQFSNGLTTSTGAKLLSINADATSGNTMTTNTTHRVNGTTYSLTRIAGSATTFLDYTATNGTLIGSYNNAGTNAFTNLTMLGHIYEIIVYNVRLSTDQVGFIERYLGRKWGIAI